MKLSVFLSLAVIALFNFSLFGDELPKAGEDSAAVVEENGALRFRSKPDATFWIYGNGGVEAGSWGINSGGGTGLRDGIGARLQFGHWGIVAEWTHQNITYYQPDPYSELRTYGLGITYRTRSFGQRQKFWRGSHFLGHLIAEYGSNRYDLYDWHDRYLTSGKTWGAGGNIGADFMMPVFFGFWGFAGTGFEALQFRYDVPANTQGIRDANHPTLNFYFRAGIAYGI